MNNAMEATPFLYMDKVERLLKQEMKSNKDFQNEIIEVNRVIDLFGKNATLRMNWQKNTASEKQELVVSKIQAVSHKGRGVAFNVFVKHEEGVEILLSLVPNEDALEKETKKVFEYIKGYGLLGVQNRLDEGRKLDSNPEELLLKINPNYRKRVKTDEPEKETSEAKIAETTV